MVIARLFFFLFALVSPLTSFSAVGQAYQLGITDLEYGPEPIVMKDNKGDEALVLLYHLNTNKEIMGFRVARHNQFGELLWDTEKYVLNTNTVKSRGYTPVPVVMNDKLYVFGRHRMSSKKHKREITYTVFDSVDDLIAHAKGQRSKKFQYLEIETRKDMPKFSFTVLNGGDKGRDALLMALYEKDGSKTIDLASLRCDADYNDKLSCMHVPIKNGTKNPPALVTLPFTDSQEAVLLTQNKSYLGLQHFDSMRNSWSPLKNVASASFHSTERIGTAVLRDKVYVFPSKHGESLHAPISPALWDGEVIWKKISAPEGVNARNGTKPVVYDGRLYIFYSNFATEGKRSCQMVIIHGHAKTVCTTVYPPDMLSVMEVSTAD